LKKKTSRNLAASVHQRLLNQAEQTGEDAQYVHMRYGLERLLYRLSQSEHEGEFIVKGALLYWVWAGELYRPTKDLDLLALHSMSPSQLGEVFRDICRVVAVEDGLVFLPDTVKGEEIRENAAYQGVRVTLEARLGNARIPLQVDIGFGDVITPGATKAVFPALLDFPSAELPMYPKETVVAEKIETMVKLGIVSSRMKDYYDVWALSREFEFDGQLLWDAITATFRRRKTPLPVVLPLALSAEFTGDALKQKQWQAFLQKGRFKTVEPELTKVVAAISDFLMPVLIAARQVEPLATHWPKGGPWQPKR